MKMIFGENTKQYLLGGCIVLCALIILILVVKYVPLDIRVGQPHSRISL